MKLLFDQNLSPRLCDRLRDIWTDPVHVRTVGLAAADDSAIWTFAQRHGFTIVSKDGDFSGRASLYGAPPKVIWLTRHAPSPRLLSRAPRPSRCDAGFITGFTTASSGRRAFLTRLAQASGIETPTVG